VGQDDCADLHRAPVVAGGGKPGTGLGARSVQLTLGRLTAAFETAMLEGLIPRNVAKLVKPPKYEPGEPDTWSKTEVRRFLGKARTDRLHAAWRLSLYGLRRGEVLGLRWAEDVDFGSFTKPCKSHSERWCIRCYGSGTSYKPATIQVQRRGRQIATVAVARNLLTLIFYGLRDGHIRALRAPPEGGGVSGMGRDQRRIVRLSVPHRSPLRWRGRPLD
jgi:integrase